MGFEHNAKLNCRVSSLFLDLTLEPSYLFRVCFARLLRSCFARSVGLGQIRLRGNLPKLISV